MLCLEIPIVLTVHRAGINLDRVSFCRQPQQLDPLSYYQSNRKSRDLKSEKSGSEVGKVGSFGILLTKFQIGCIVLADRPSGLNKLSFC